MRATDGTTMAGPARRVSGLPGDGPMKVLA